MFKTSRSHHPFGIISRRGVLGGSLAATLLAGTACRATAAMGPEIDARAFGARGDGRSDDTPALQAALDSLRGGGTLRVSPGRYSVNSLTVRNRGIRIVLDPAAIIVKRGRAGLASRGIFLLDGLQDAAFELAGGTIDLNGEGPMGIGAPNRIPNTYSPLMIATARGLSGPTNAAIFARRSSAIAVTGVAILNSGESGLLFRNCGRIAVRGCRFSNLANYGVEFSFTDPGADGGSGPMPARGDVSVTDCQFEDIDDYGLGSGNGVGIGGGGAGNLGRFLNYRIADCTFARCHRDIHFEFQSGSWIEQFAIETIGSADARQGSIGLIGARRGTIADVSIVNPGAAPTALLLSERPDIYGIVLSTDFSDIILRDISIVDRRPGRLAAANGVAIDRGSRTLTTPGATFTEDDVGGWIGIPGANPGAAPYVGRIARVVSPRHVELDLPAGAAVRGGRAVTGGTLRNGIILNRGSNVTLENVRIIGGAASDPQGQNDAAAIRMQDMTGFVRFDNIELSAPAGSPTNPAGLSVIRNRARITGTDSIRATGFARARTERR